MKYVVANEISEGRYIAICPYCDAMLKYYSIDFINDEVNADCMLTKEEYIVIKQSPITKVAERYMV